MNRAERTVCINEIRDLVAQLNAPQQNFAYLLDARKRQQEEG